MIQTIDAPGFRSIGQEAAGRILRHAAQRRQLSRTLLVSGPTGAGKGAFVDDLLALVFCAEPDAARRPCNECRGCRDGRARTHPDLVVGSPDIWRERRSTGESIVASARRWLLEASGAPVVADRRIVLIEHADRANEQTQNALLKALEEPTDRHTFVLVADEPTRLLPTVRSRCRSLRIGRVPHADLTAFLIEDRQLPADLADALARLADGLAGRAVELVERKDLLSWRRRVQAELLSLIQRGRAERFAAVRDLLDETARLGATPVSEGLGDQDGVSTPASAQRAAAALLVDAWLALTRDLIVAAAGRPELAPGGELGAELAVTGPKVGVEPLVRCVGLLERIHEGLRESAAPKLALEAAMLAWPMLPPSRDR